MQKKFFAHILIIAVLFCFVAQTYAQDNLDKYFKELNSLEKAVRDKAASILEKEGAKIIPALKDLIKSDKSTLRQKQYALIILGKVADEKILPFIKEQFDAQRENIVKIECMKVAVKYSAANETVTMLKNGVASENAEISMFATQLAYTNKVVAVFPELIANLENAKTVEQVKIASALAGSGMFHNKQINEDMRSKFVAALSKNIETAKDNVEYKYQLTFAYGYTGNEAAIEYLLEILKDQKFVSDVQAEIAKLEEAFKKTEEELKDKKEELAIKRQELRTKINSLREGIAEKQIRYNDTAATILAKHFGEKAFKGFAELLKNEKSSEYAESFYVYAVNSSSSILNSFVSHFAEKAPEKINGEDSEAVKELETMIKNFENYMTILKSGFVKHLVANPESFKTLLPLDKHYNNHISADRMLECLAQISTPETITEIIKAFDEESKVADEVKVIILSKLKALGGNQFFKTEVTNYNRDEVLKMIVKPVVDVLSSNNDQIVSEALQVIKASSKHLFNEYLKTISDNIKRVLQNSDEKIIALACEVLVMVDSGNAVKIMLQVYDSITNIDARKKVLEAFAQASFASTQEITKFLSIAEKDLLDNEKDIELRKAAASAIKKTSDPKAVEILIKSFTNINVSSLAEIEKSNFKIHIIEQLRDMRNAARTATSQIISEMTTAMNKYNEIKDSTELDKKMLQNSYTLLIRKGISALENIRNLDVIDEMQTFLNFEVKEINIDVLGMLKAFATDDKIIKKVFELITNSIQTLKQTGGLISTESRINYMIEILQVITDISGQLKGKTKNDARSVNREMLALDNIDVLKKSIELTGALKDRRSRSVLRDLMKKHPELKTEIEAALEAMK